MVAILNTKFTVQSVTGSNNVALGQQSDHLLIVAVFHGWLVHRSGSNRAKTIQYVKDNLLHEPTLETIRIYFISPGVRFTTILGELRKQFAEILIQAKLITQFEERPEVSKDISSLVRCFAKCFFDLFSCERCWLHRCIQISALLKCRKSRRWFHTGAMERIESRSTSLRSMQNGVHPISNTPFWPI